MLAAKLKAYGDPVESVEVVHVEEPGDPGPGQALVSVEYSPINPADLLLIRGYYVLRPDLPSMIGNEGVGRVLAVGPSVSHLKPGDRVVAPLSSFVWRERLLLPASNLVSLPSSADPRQLSMLTVNPVTAQLLLSAFVTLKPGNWIIQNAANSGVGRSVIAFARHRGYRTINIVRRQEAAQEIKAIGGDIAIVDGPGVVERVRASVADVDLRLGLDGVSGEATATLASLLGPGGFLACYGAMGGGQPTVGPGDLIYKQLKVGGFFLGSPEYADRFPALIREGARLIEAGKLSVPIAATYRLEDLKQALVHAQRGGKVLLQIAGN